MSERHTKIVHECYAAHSIAPQSLGQGTISVDTNSAIDTPLAQSSALWPQAVQHAERMQATQRQELQALQQRAAAQHSSAMAKGPSL